ncbi:MAG: hypothetical protein ACHP9T_08420 [Caulobacterales bacterium]|jgi:hypothetical protein
MTNTDHPIRKYAATLVVAPADPENPRPPTTLEVRVPAQLIRGEVAVTVDGRAAVIEGPGGSQTDAFTIIGSSIVLHPPFDEGGYVEVTFGDHG